MALGVIAGRMYLEHRYDLFGLGDANRAVLYGAVALAVFALAATSRLWRETGILGGMLWMAMLGAAAWAIYSVWRAYRAY